MRSKQIRKRDKRIGAVAVAVLAKCERTSLRKFTVTGLAALAIPAAAVAAAGIGRSGSSAQADDARDRYGFCNYADRNARVTYSTTIFNVPVSANENDVKDQWKDFWRKQGGDTYDTFCLVSSELASVKDSKDYTDGLQVRGADNLMHTHRLETIDWKPEFAELEKKSEAKVATAEPPKQLKILPLRWPAKDGAYVDGYLEATVDLKYRFIACMGEVHVAYSLDPNSVQVSNQYAYKRALIGAGDAKPPRVGSVAFTANVYDKGKQGFGRSIAYVADKFAGPSLGYGCFTGQTQKIGRVRDFTDPNAGPKEIDAILNERLSLSDGHVDTADRLRNAAVEGNAKSASDEKYERDKAAYDQAMREHDQAVSKYDSDLQTMKEQQQRNAAAAQRAANVFAEQQSAYEAEKKKADDARAAYEQQMRDMGYTPQP